MLVCMCVCVYEYVCDCSLLNYQTLMAFVQGDILMSVQNVGYSSTNIHVLFGVYADTYNNGAILHCFMFSFLCDCTDCIS